MGGSFSIFFKCFGGDNDEETIETSQTQNIQQHTSNDDSYENLNPKIPELYEEVNCDDYDYDDENCCPTCFIEYTDENPKIVAKCSHHYHLPCIFAWQEKSNLCPACSRVLEFEEFL